MSDQEKKPKKQPSKLVKTLGAMLGGVIEACTLQPLDVVKTRLQLSQTSLIPLVKEMFIHEGPRSFYKGLTPFVTHLVTKYSVSSIYYFSDLQVRWYFNEFYRGLLADKDGKVMPKM
jgi:solute carrier family 25 citrate transporter 1